MTWNAKRSDLVKIKEMADKFGGLDSGSLFRSDANVSNPGCAIGMCAAIDGFTSEPSNTTLVDALDMITYKATDKADDADVVAAMGAFPFTKRMVDSGLTYDMSDSSVHIARGYGDHTIRVSYDLWEAAMIKYGYLVVDEAS